MMITLLTVIKHKRRRENIMQFLLASFFCTTYKLFNFSINILLFTDKKKKKYTYLKKKFIEQVVIFSCELIPGSWLGHT